MPCRSGSWPSSIFKQLFSIVGYSSASTGAAIPLFDEHGRVEGALTGGPPERRPLFFMDI